jgi:hypothetical protein
MEKAAIDLLQGLTIFSRVLVIANDQVDRRINERACPKQWCIIGDNRQ